ncbi:MAG: hypothetical protein Q7V56_11560 [Gammaproteobacteria bacterium]|nr:hypothetical protein [Gammaproteobacteria bacterium]
MPKAILAIRTYPATLIIALLLFMATLVMTAASMGTAGVGGGDDGDGGSGIGGTGKSGEFGGSGFGGTGGPSPFITSVDDQEPVAPTPASDALEPEIALSQDLADSIEQSAILIESDSTLASGNTPDVVEPSIPVPALSLPEKALEVQLAEARPVVPERVQPSVVVKQPELARSGEVEVFDEAALDPQLQIVQQDQSNRPSDLAVESLNTAAGAESVSVKLETAAKENEQEIDRSALPDRIQRPDLPPFQRVRPVDRASIMVPSRVQPMRI